MRIVPTLPTLPKTPILMTLHCTDNSAQVKVIRATRWQGLLLEAGWEQNRSMTNPDYDENKVTSRANVKGFEWPVYLSLHSLPAFFHTFVNTVKKYPVELNVFDMKNNLASRNVAAAIFGHESMKAGFEPLPTFIDNSGDTYALKPLPMAPAQEKIVSMLPQVKRAADMESWECGICLDTVEEDAVFSTLPCVHRFHFECIRAQVLNEMESDSLRCPICRTCFSAEADELITAEG